MDYDIVEKVASYVEANNMLTTGDKVVAGVSGGADSVCLLFLLCKFREKMDLDIHVIHVNHGIRKEAGQDAAFVTKLCKSWNIPCKVVEVNIPEIAKKEGLTEEEAGRIERYKIFENEAKSLAPYGVKIAVAHNMDDNAETVLFHLFRGSGLHGLTGILPVRSVGRGENVIIRPVLCLERKEIESLLISNNIDWVTDATNALDEYARNRIRHHILPEAEMVSSGASRSIIRSANRLAQIEQLINQLVKECLDSCVKVRGMAGASPCIILDANKLNEYHEAIVSESLFLCLKDVTGGGKDIGEMQVKQLMELVREPVNRKFDLARGVCAFRSYDEISIVKGQKTVLDKPEIAKVNMQEIDVTELDEGIDKLIEKASSDEEINKYTKWLDYDKIDGQIEVRTRQSGDFLLIARGDGTFGKKSLKDYMIDKKIPSDLRNHLTIVAAGHKCLWLVGYRISDDCFLSQDTKRILKLTCDKYMMNDNIS